MSRTARSDVKDDVSQENDIATELCRIFDLNVDEEWSAIRYNNSNKIYKAQSTIHWILYKSAHMQYSYGETKNLKKQKN